VAPDAGQEQERERVLTCSLFYSARFRDWARRIGFVFVEGKRGGTDALPWQRLSPFFFFFFFCSWMLEICMVYGEIYILLLLKTKI
jgi:hypothetical protein